MKPKSWDEIVQVVPAPAGARVGICVSDDGGSNAELVTEPLWYMGLRRRHFSNTDEVDTWLVPLVGNEFVPTRFWDDDDGYFCIIMPGMRESDVQAAFDRHVEQLKRRTPTVGA